MQEAIELAGVLNEQIKKSEEYSRYVEADQQLRKEPELYNRYNEFRRRNYELQFSDGNLYDEVINLVKEYDAILQNSIVNDFILAERRFCLLMQEVYTVLSKELELDFEYLEK